MVTTQSPTPRPRRPGGFRTVIGIALLVVVVLGGTVACGGDGQGAAVTPVAGVTEVTVRDNRFEPAAIEVPVGTTVTWRWAGNSQHNVVGDGFESEVQKSGEFAHAFAEPGTYDYHCTLHGSMRGAVVVVPEAA